MPVDELDVLFAYVLSLITAISLTVIPDLNRKMLYLVISSVMFGIAVFAKALYEREVI